MRSSASDSPVSCSVINGDVRGGEDHWRNEGGSMPLSNKGQEWSQAKRRLDISCIPTPAKSSRIRSPSPRAIPEKLERGLAKEVVDYNGQSSQRLKVCGPEFVQTLRGRLFGRDVALIVCGESHEDTIDLTRKHAVTEAQQGWVTAPHLDNAGFNVVESMATMDGLTLSGAQKWADDLLSERDEEDTEGSMLLFEPRMGKSVQNKGLARVFLPGCKRSSEHNLPPDAIVLELASDLDEEARNFNQRRAKGLVSVDEQDALISQRKFACLSQGFELFDDWFVRQAGSKGLHVEFIMEAPVSADEVELHVESGVAPAPPAHSRLRRLQADEKIDSEDKSLGGGAFLDYLRRRIESQTVPGRFHGIDPRMLGDAEDEQRPEGLRGSFQSLLREPLPKDHEIAELDALGADLAWEEAREGVSEVLLHQPAPLPSWEGFFGGAADLLYYAPHVKADYTPFLAGCVGSGDALKRFFDALYFQTVPAAVKELRINEKTRPLAHIRSLALQPPSRGAPLQRRPTGRRHSGKALVPVRAAPLDRYLKARGFEVPRTWVSGLAERLRRAGHGRFVIAARAWYQRVVSHMLADPKGHDLEGDNFCAWLRQCHQDVYRDVDTFDPAKLRRTQWAQSKKHPKSKKHRHNLKNIRIPGFEDAFAEILAANGVSSSREQVLSKMIVDGYQLRLVDLAMVLQAAQLVARAPEGEPVVLVFYAGADHARSTLKFWRQQGFSDVGLPRKGFVGKDNYEDDESRCLTFPSYLHDFSKLFPLPKSLQEKRVSRVSQKLQKRSPARPAARQ